MTPRELVVEFIALMRRQQWLEASALLAEEVFIDAGLGHRGHGRPVFEHYAATITEIVRDNEVEMALIDLLSSDERVVLIQCQRHRLGGEVLELRRCSMFRVVEQEIVEFVQFDADAEEIAKVLAHADA